MDDTPKFSLALEARFITVIHAFVPLVVNRIVSAIAVLLVYLLQHHILRLNDSQYISIDTQVLGI